MARPQKGKGQGAKPGSSLDLASHLTPTHKLLTQEEDDLKRWASGLTLSCPRRPRMMPSQPLLVHIRREAGRCTLSSLGMAVETPHQKRRGPSYGTAHGPPRAWTASLPRPVPPTLGTSALSLNLCTRAPPTLAIHTLFLNLGRRARRARHPRAPQKEGRAFKSLCAATAMRSVHGRAVAQICSDISTLTSVITPPLVGAAALGGGLAACADTWPCPGCWP